MLWLLFLLFFVRCTEGECPGEDFSLAPRPYTNPKNFSVCEKPYRGPSCTCPSSMFECACHKFGRCGYKPGCIEMWKVNDEFNNNNCGDWSDQFGEVCPKGRFQCDCFNTTCKGFVGCVRERWRCDGSVDCLDGSDEVNCTCSAHKFECGCYKTKNCTSYDLGCINKDSQCNGYNDCGDWSDEVNCTCLADKFECPCYKTKNCTTYRGCIDKYSQCDGYNDCGDWSDEVNCTTCPAIRQFECPCYKTRSCTTRYGCIHKDNQCDGNNNCGDMSDEVNCTTCPADTFECDCSKTNICTTGNGCIYKNMQCDGRNDCGDWSDEVNCYGCIGYQFECDCYKTKNCTTGNGCIPRYLHCDGTNTCGDWSDEVHCTCPYKFECDCYKTKNCKTEYGCIGKDLKCDGNNNCGDWSDEVNCTCPAHKFQCACVDTKQCDIGVEGSCIDRSLLCDGNRDCFDGSDETHYTCNCSGAYARCPCDPSNKHCPSTGRCIPFHWVGDTFKDCYDGSDEHCSVSNFTFQSCTMFATTCKSEQLARYLVHSTVPAECNTVIQPSCADDINSCESKNVVCVSSNCKKKENFCQDFVICENKKIIGGRDFCDGVSNCSDNSDEIKSGFGFKCSGSSRQGVCVLPQTNVYDSVAQCSDKSDLCFVKGQFKCFQCLDKKLIISPKQVCDGIVDCFDMSDECLCFNQSLCNDIRGACPSNQMYCQNKSVCSVSSGKLCNSSVQCVDQVNTKYCSSANNLKQIHCLPENSEGLGVDKIFKCAKIDNELLRRRFQYQLGRGIDARVLLNSICDGKFGDNLGFYDEVNCPNMFYCFSQEKFSIKNTQVCNGYVDCDDGSDEFLELCNKTRFYCKSKDVISIDKTNVCDGIIDCDNESDESKCHCEKIRFYCTNKQPLSVERKLVQNGIQDCSDGSDECVNLAGDAFADVNEMIANPIYRAIFWLTAVLALGGNSFVFIATAHSLWKVDKHKNVFINTSIFLLNLCCSDFLMGIYLLVVIVQATRFSGLYCLFDKEWRSSSLCSGLGALVVVSSEASAMTMTAMTTFRLVSAFKPFTIRNVGVFRILLAELFCWISAVVLATVPLLRVTSEYFITDVWFPNNIFGNDFVSRENMSLLAEKITGVEPESWIDVKKIINETFPRNSIKGEFGYYGETSVCMPRLFATTSEFAWEYSTFLITINFFMFIYMVVAYVLIYKQSNRMKGSRSNDVSSKMQKRISRLILTDFCCWIPICVMAYLSIGGIKMPPDAYVLSACLLLPINSALNPLLYSKAIEDQLVRAKKSLVENLFSLPTSTIHSSDLAVRHNAGTKEEGDRVIETIE